MPAEIYTIFTIGGFRKKEALSVIHSGTLSSIAIAKSSLQLNSGLVNAVAPAELNRDGSIGLLYPSRDPLRAGCSC